MSAGERLTGTILFGDFGDFGVSFAATVTLTLVAGRYSPDFDFSDLVSHSQLRWRDVTQGGVGTLVTLVAHS